jgi:hypothetical protein
MLTQQRKGKGKRELLMPIRLDSEILNTKIEWAVSIRKHITIRSFENWKQPSPYQKMLNDLLDDLRKN